MSFAFTANRPGKPAQPSVHWFQTALVWLAGYDQRILLAHQLGSDFSTATALGAVALVCWVLNAGIFAVAGHLAFGNGGLNFGLVFAGILLSLTIAMIESYVDRTSQIPRGIQKLQNTGLEIADPESFAASIKYFVLYRIGLCLLTALIGTTTFNLVLYGPDLAAYESRAFQANNSRLYELGTKQFEAESQQVSEALTQQTRSVAALEKQTSLLRQRTINAGRKASGATDSTQLERLERKLGEEKLRLAALREQASKQNSNRNTAINTFIESAPEKTPRQEGLIAKLSAFHALIIEKPAVLLMVIAIELLLAGLDGAGFIARLCTPGTVYSEILAKEHIKQSIVTAKSCAEEVAALLSAETVRAENAPDVELASPASANNNMAPTANDNAITDKSSGSPAKRKRGRPTLQEQAERARLNGHADPKDGA